ncbi:unnamed protein product [Rhizophagus irregularis]|uniref:Uncharacterized protein n=1 Tax=Rhizophagus irregularis (strain DAOM 197198w) TaxID=1432141 RepID=A0A015JJR0_RHIIW|nr:hypothetical protein RirG_227940 [Rhizophagus irregularis DAOM 197198w]CAB4387427.1 unnamed protein product [Rhizophagus irregularis]
MKTIFTTLSQYRAPYERPPPGSPLTYGQTSRGDYTSGSTSTQRTAYMAPRPRQVMVHLWYITNGKN